ncbi:MAG: paraquat-inducible protein A [Qingshengfaniella sp.]
MADPHPSGPTLTARGARLQGCLHCGEVWPLAQTRCDRCGARLSSRYPQSLQRVWAWWLAGLIVYVPANLYPMLITETLAYSGASTIFGGVVELLHHGSYFVGGVVFFASMVIPISKFVAIAWLAIAIRRRVTGPRAHRLHRVYEIVEFIGRWSMIDVFVVAILAALVHLGTVADIYPGIAAVSFAMSVIFTMLSALCFDPRLIWDNSGDLTS